MTKISAVYFFLHTLSLIFLIFSAAVALPLVWRGFYYMHINALHLTEITPWSYDEIRAAYDEMMDFCMHGAPFGTGVLKWSEEGMLHFADCRVLFMLDLRVLLVSFTAVVLLLAFGKPRNISMPKICGRGPFFWAGVIPAVIFIALVVLVALTDFDQAFVTFHHMFFPGKSNWLFNPYEDEIINVLPEVFFMDCAILIVVVIVVLSIVSILIDRSLRKKK